MALNYHYPVVNPRLGTSFAIFTSAYISLVVTLLILEQLGLENFWISQVMILIPILFYLVIGLLVRTTNLEDFFIAGERVPALYNGLSLSANIMSGTALMTGMAALFFLGFDGLPLLLGWCGGIALLAMALAPYLRKTGSFTLPGLLGMRFSSRGVRALAAVILFVPSLLLLVAELKIGAMVGSLFLPLTQDMLIVAGLTIALLSVLPGGFRSLTWMQCAQVIVLLLGLIAPLIIVSLELTNLPIPQLTYGGILAEMSALEVAKGVTQVDTQPIAQVLPGLQAEQLVKPFMQPFGALSGLDFLLLSLCVMVGTAMLPTQITRLSTTPTIMAARGSMGWAGLVVGFVVLTLPAYAAFAHFYLLRDVIGTPLAQMPDWVQFAKDLGIIEISADTLDPAFGQATVSVHGNLSTFLLPVAARLPYVFLGVVVAGVLAVVLAATAGHLVAMGNALSNDLFYPLSRRPAPAAHRLLVARLGMILAGLAAVWLARGDNVDPIRWMLWAFSLAGGSFFAVVILSIWWIRTTLPGVYAGLLAGFGVTAAQIMLAGGGDAGVFGVDTLTAAVIGVPVAFAATVIVSLVTSAPGEFVIEIAEDMRVPGGETVHARLLRLSGRGKAPRP